MQQLNNIKHKLQQLVKQYLQLQKENMQLRENAAVYTQTIQQQKTAIDDLKKKLDVTQLQQLQLSKQDKVAIEKRINNYIKEIDICLSLLNKS
ncbi:MAG: hypothetical protein NTZ59_04540 [Bacteroidetes bacterium]|nr:hypothetical protein [Bacteroidota bacterium]